MAFTFFKYVHGGPNDLYGEKSIKPVSGYPMYIGQALTLSGGLLIYAQTADKVYAISNVSAASSVVTADFIPEVFPVNTNQVWQGTLGVAITAVTLAGSQIDINDASSFGTAVNGGKAATSLLIYNIATGSTPSTSAIYVIFQPAI